MPLYEYRCDQCGEVFEVMQKFADEPLKTHEKCGGGPVHRLLSAPALQFKGSGWYITDYAKSGSTRPAGKSEGSGEKSSSENGTSSKDSAPAKSDSSPAPASTSTSTSDKK